MTLERAGANVQFQTEPAPAGGLEGVKAWAAAMFERLWLEAQTPRVQRVQFARLEQAGEVSKPGEGQMCWLAANLAGAGKPEGLYIYMGGAWKQVQLL